MNSPATAPDPYAAYGGKASVDPYAAYGGAKMTTPAPAAPAATPPPAAATPDDDTLGGQAQEAVAGFKTGLNQTGETAMKAIHAIPGIGELLDKTKFGESMAQTHAIANQPVDTIAGKTGEGLETIAEFLTGEEALKGLTLGQKLAKIGPVLQIMEKYPRLAAAASAGMRQGAVGGVQAALHGDTATGSAETALATGVTGGAADIAIPAATGAVKNLLEKIRPSTTEIAGETIPVLASQKAGAAPIAGKLATAANTPEVAAAQQQGGQAAVQNIAQRATRDALERINATRRTATAAAITDPARMLTAGDEPFQFRIEGGGVTGEQTTGDLLHPAAKRPQAAFKEPSYVTGTAPKPNVPGSEGSFGNDISTSTATTPRSDTVVGRGDIVTTDPAKAQSYLSQLNDLTDSAQFKALPKEQQAVITGQRDSLQDQLGMYHAGNSLTPHFDPVDTEGAVSHVTSFADGSDQIQHAVSPIYQKLDQVSGGQFTALRNQVKVADKVMFKPSSTDAFRRALDSKDEAEAGIQELFNRHGGSVNRDELASAQSAWRDSSTLNSIHAAVEGAFKGAPKDLADATGTNRLLRGNNMTTRLNTLLKVNKTPGAQRVARANVERVIGPDGLENLYRVGNLLSTPETAIPTQSAFQEIAKHLTRRAGIGAFVGGVMGHVFGPIGAIAGGTIGASAEDGVRYVMRQAAINPKVGIMIDRAVRHQVSPRIFAPLIATMISHPPPDQDQGQEGQNPTEPREKVTSLEDGGGDAAAADTGNGAASGTAALAQMPDSIKQALDTVPVRVTNASAYSGGGDPAIASVVEHDPNTIEVNDQQRFAQDPKQVVAHEATHIWQNNLPPSLQAKIPAEPESENAQYDISKIAQARAQGKTMLDLPREQQATIVQRYVANPAMRKQLQPWIDDMAKLPLSGTMPTAPHADKMNTATRPPTPADAERFMESTRSQSAVKKPKERRA